METKQITAANADDQLKQLYLTAFPEGEQIPWDDLLQLVGEMPLDFTAYYKDGELIGFTIVYPRKSISWYWYFAVREELRGKGYGQQILAILLEQYKGQTCVLDMEAVEQRIPSSVPKQPSSEEVRQRSEIVCSNFEQRVRRHNFYLRNGFRDTDLYRTYNDITMTIMIIGPGTFSMQDWDEIVGELKRFWWPEDLEEQIETIPLQ